MRQPRNAWLFVVVLAAPIGPVSEVLFPRVDAAPALASALEFGNQEVELIDFAKSIQPIFKERCVSCHGPDYQDGGIRLDRRSGAFLEDKTLIVPGKPESSEVYRRIILPADDFDIMPAEGDTLTSEQIATIKKWIEEGASWPVDEAEEVESTSDSMVLPELSEEERGQQEAQMSEIKAMGAIAMRVAVNIDAIDVNLSLLGSKANDSNLKALWGLAKSIIWLNLSRTGISDEGVSSLASLKELRRLNLSNTSIGDRGIQSLGVLPHLRYLNLYGTSVSDASVEFLSSLPQLRKLYLWQTDVAEQGLAKLRAARPELMIDTGQYLEPVVEEETEEVKTLINDKCPVTGEALAVGVETDFEGHRIGFCCEKCLQIFVENPGEYRDQLPLPVVDDTDSEDSKPINTICPVSGAEANSKFVSKHQDRIVAFCCEKCRAAFIKDPGVYEGKLPPGTPKPEKNPDEEPKDGESSEGL